MFLADTKETHLTSDADNADNADNVINTEYAADTHDATNAPERKDFL